jgi:AcrR family transcriptional regulator
VTRKTPPASPAPPPTDPTRGVGRPRRLTLDALLDAAAELGEDAVTMKRLSEHLGVGVATLYRYVPDRDALLRLLAGRRSYRKPPRDEGQGWQHLVLGYADSIHSSLTSQPGLLRAYLDGTLTAELEAEFVDSFLAALVGHGFTPEAALQLYRDMALIVTGASVVEVHRAALQARGESFAQHVQAALRQHDSEELPLLRQVHHRYADDRARGDWQRTLRRVLGDVARERGEPPPPA